MLQVNDLCFINGRLQRLALDGVGVGADFLVGHLVPVPRDVVVLTPHSCLGVFFQVNGWTLVSVLLV